MHKCLNILSQIVSIVFYPMLMPLYGMLLYALSTQPHVSKYSTAYTAMFLSGTAILTLLIPVALLLILWRKGYIDSLHIDDAKQRTTPYIYTLICYGFWAYFLRVTMKMPLFLLLVAIGAIVALLIVTIINSWWKISAHLTGIGGLLGGICSYALYSSSLPIGLICITLMLALILMYARLYLEAHTNMQVVCGFLLGIVCTFIPTLITHA